MSRFQFGDKLIAHCLIGEQIIALAGEKSGNSNLVILIRLYPELTAMVTIRNQRLVQLLYRKRQREILGVTVPDVADQAMKNSI